MPLIWLFFVLFLPFLIAIFFFQVAAFSFTKLGLSPESAILLLGLCLVGGMINIPVTRRRYPVKRKYSSLLSYLFYYPPKVYEQVIAVNLGGAVIPVLFSLYLLNRASLWPVLLTTIVVTFTAKALSRPEPGVGISLPAFIPPIIAALAALMFTQENAAPVAYIAGVWGTLIGADLMNFNKFKNLGAHVISIGGAGVFDGIFLVGIAAALLT